MADLETFETNISGLDCSECARHVRQAIEQLHGVRSAKLFVGSRKAVVQYDPALTDPAAIRMALKRAGYNTTGPLGENQDKRGIQNYSRRILGLLALVFGAVLCVVVLGEWLGLFRRITSLVPFWLGVTIVLLTGWPVLKNVLHSALRGRATPHTLMTMGLLAALVVGEWTTAAVIVFFMRVGDYAESFTTESARTAVNDLMQMAPQTARVERGGSEQEVAMDAVTPEDLVIVRPGEKIPVDGTVLEGHGTIDQAAITGESMPAEATAGSHVYAATIVQLGSLKIRPTRIGADSAFGRVVRMVEQAEANRAVVQRFADKFSGYFLPIVAAIALLTFILRRDPLSVAAVLVVACSCSIALATPIAMLASVGASAKRGLLIKGGKYIESLAKADVLLIDKTGTLTLGRPEITDIVPCGHLSADAILALAASVERYSEHPLAQALVAAARARNLRLFEASKFAAVPGKGVRATVEGAQVVVGSRQMLSLTDPVPPAQHLEALGKTLLYVERDGRLVGVLAAADTLREEVPTAIHRMRALGMRDIELLTGDHEQAAAALARQIGVAYRANLLPELKIAAVKEYQALGRVVVMVGDGVNDAPALAQADVGIAMGAAGTDIAIEASHIALMREDWGLIPEAFLTARRTMSVVKSNLVFTGIYNVVGLTLAALGFLPPILAAAAQSLPDLGILANSARLLRHQQTPPK
ncbi:heavy metal translocating P-type ATPase [Desulfoferrobacter suflitae]|uniref:heavy metal translocating P-type ATPase n=1 Tax=Desulfoferrobacter suflitae TaxID=2865782 RepID=UPI0021644909|nr:cation-translocating P-type ATPase [Desulfoferrobacter suflitae]MCK8602863.1 cation-translocating P-type ATPase [Desulfoferrobacter suflitae]